MAEQELWTTAQAAEHCGVRPSTYRDYVSRQGAPKHVSRQPGRGQDLYLAEAVRAWHAKRPGRGARTDLPRETQPSGKRPMTNQPPFTLVSAEDVTDEILELAVTITDDFYPDQRIDWGDVWDRMDGATLTDGRELDVGTDLMSPALVKIKAYVRGLRKMG